MDFRTVTAKGKKFVSANIGILVVGNGLALLATPGPSVNGKTGTVSGPVDTLRTNEGEVAASFFGVHGGGFQTDDGFWVTGTEIPEPDGTPTEITIIAKRLALGIAVNTGRYGVRCKTILKIQGTQLWTTDWEGEAALVATNTEVHAMLVMRNKAGGSTEMYASGALDSNGRFDLTANSSRLVGTLRAGALSADWTDVRDSEGVYSGRLEGERK